MAGFRVGGHRNPHHMVTHGTIVGDGAVGGFPFALRVGRAQPLGKGGAVIGVEDIEHVAPMGRKVLCHAVLAPETAGPPHFLCVQVADPVPDTQALQQFGETLPLRQHPRLGTPPLPPLVPPASRGDHGQQQPGGAQRVEHSCLLSRVGFGNMVISIRSQGLPRPWLGKLPRTRTAGPWQRARRGRKAGFARPKRTIPAL